MKPADPEQDPEKFQSSPGAHAGRNVITSNIESQIKEFQSSPGAHAGRNAA